MDILSMQFLSALLAIIVIDLVLAGDNAIVIALAARSLPKHLQKRAILWGTVGAIVVRTSLTLIVVWLLQIPGLLFAGGALLIWIAYKLLIPENGDDHAGKVAATATFWGALRTVVIADTIMGLDNVLAVAGAAHGSFLLVVLGLLVSIPIVIWGSTLILRVVERYPGVRLRGRGRARVDRRQDDDRRAVARRLLHGAPSRGAAALPRHRARRAVARLDSQSPQARVADQRAHRPPRANGPGVPFRCFRQSRRNSHAQDPGPRRRLP